MTTAFCGDLESTCSSVAGFIFQLIKNIGELDFEVIFLLRQPWIPFDQKQQVSSQVNVNMERVPSSSSSSSSSITPADDEQVFPGLNENDIVERASFQGPYDSLVVESGKQSYLAFQSIGVVLHLAFQSIGVVYGDIGTSPLYVFTSTFSNGIKHEDDVFGVLSLIVYSLSLIPLLKYVFIVLQANDNGEGGTFALYWLICRYARVGLIPSQQAEDSLVSNFQLELPSKQLERGSRLKSMLEKSVSAKYILLFATMLGTSMVIGYGILTPCITVLSAVGGIKQASESMTQEMVVWTSVGILIVLFSAQRVGADKVGYCFAPIICIWFLLIASIGCYNIVKYDPTVLKALNPKYMVGYFRRNKKEARISLGGVVLATTGTEALFADVGHFTVRSIQISMCCVTCPALLLAYTGQAAFLAKHPDLVSEAFYKSIPEGWFWAVLLVAVLASIIASQAMISGTFAIIKQSLSLGCFPRVKIVHTSSKFAGQVYIPEAKYLLMLASIGIAVVFVMTLTSAFLVLIMLMIWNTNLLIYAEMVVWTSVGILIVLFSVQRVGADKVGYYFAPIICIWFLLIANIGCYNIVKYDPTLLKALNPKYMVGYFRRNKKEAWISLGGVVLATTGTEALFADVGHFTVRSIQISMCCVTYPALLLAYTGQAAFLAKHPDLVSEAFYKSIPEGWFWPVLLVAVLASIIASQAMISGTFAIIKQSLSLGCFPRVKIVHTSSKFAGQVYIPEAKYLLMLASIGIAVVFVMTLTSAFLVLIMLMIWNTNILLVIAFILTIGSVEIVYLSSVLYKFNQGGYLPLAFAAPLVNHLQLFLHLRV
ncbi:Potassium transporter 5 [Linum grandiflorum]